jgi:hypothetical protein
MTENEDLYDDEQAPQQVGNGPINKAPPTKMQNIAALAGGPKTGKVLMVTGGAVVFAVALIFVMFTTRNQAKPLPASVQGASVGSPPGLAEVPSAALAKSPQYNSMVDEIDNKRIAAARDAGQSVQPMAETVNRDLRPSMTPEQLAQGQGRPQGPAAPVPPSPTLAPPPPLPVAYQPPATNYQSGNAQDPAAQAQMAQAQQAMAALIATRPRGAQTFMLTDPAAARVTQPAAAVAKADQAGNKTPAARTLIQAGSIESVRLDSAINTDLSGDFVGTLVTGSYAGSKVVGTARRTGTLAGLQFRSLSLAGQGVTIPITATGIDATSLEAGTASDVDRKLLTKYMIKPLAAGVAAIGEAVKSGGTTVIINGSSTVQTAADITAQKAERIALGAAAGQVVADAEALNTTPTVRVYPGAIVGIMFTADVVYTPHQPN